MTWTQLRCRLVRSVGLDIAPCFAVLIQEAVPDERLDDGIQ